MARSLLDRFVDRYDLLGGMGQVAHGGMLSGGFCWCRPAGGYTLYRSVGDRAVQSDGIAVGAQSATSATPDKICQFPGFQLPASSLCHFWVWSVSPGGAESEAPVTPVSLTTDENGVPVGPPPGVVRRLMVWAAAGGMIRVAWEPPDRLPSQPRPASYAVYHDGGLGELAVEPAAEPAGPGCSLGPFAHGTQVRVAVRAVSADGVYGGLSSVVSVAADAEGPEAAPAPTLSLGREE